jgi:hypothetical protein
MHSIAGKARSIARGDLSCIIGTALQMLIAGVFGALLDESDHLGVSTWLSMCRSASLPWQAALSVQVTLMPGLLISMLTIALVQLALAFRSGSARERVLVATCHLSCLLAMVAACNFCARLFANSVGAALAITAMLAVELSVCVCGAMALSALCRLLGWSSEPSSGRTPHARSLA